MHPESSFSQDEVTRHFQATSALPKLSVYHDRFKRPLECALIILALPIVVPLMILLVILASLDGGAPFYRQARVGRKGREFNVLKIRTMVPNADRVLKSYLAANPAARREWNEKQKLSDDPRITKIGAILRKTSMDELPQLWNVLRGDMALVGPRPMLVEQKELYPGQAYYYLRPGITGSWQISDRNNVSFARRAVFDTKYYQDLSLSEDIRILAGTVRVVLNGTGC